MSAYASYTCDTCNRSIKQSTSVAGLSVLPRCTITQGCRGFLVQITSKVDASKISDVPPEVAGLVDWQSRSVFYQHTQAVTSSVWNISHGLSGTPRILCYALSDDGLSYSTTLPQSTLTNYVSKITTVTFPTSIAGVAHCITNTSTVLPASTAEDTIVVGNDNGVITFATSSLEALVNVTFQVSNETINVLNIPIGADTTSAWSSASHVNINGRRMSVRSVNVSDTFGSYFTSGTIVPGSNVRVVSVSGVNISPNDVIFLLSSSPHAELDRVTRKCIDPYAVSTGMLLTTTNITSAANLTKTIFPPIST